MHISCCNSAHTAHQYCHPLQSVNFHYSTFCTYRLCVQCSMTHKVPQVLLQVSLNIVWRIGDIVWITTTQLKLPDTIAIIWHFVFYDHVLVALSFVCRPIPCCCAYCISDKSCWRSLQLGMFILSLATVWLRRTQDLVCSYGTVHRKHYVTQKMAPRWGIFYWLLITDHLFHYITHPKSVFGFQLVINGQRLRLADKGNYKR